MSKKNPSDIISGAGFVSGFFTDFVRAVKEAGGTDEDIYRLAKPEGRPILTKMAELVARKVAADAPGAFSVTVDYGMSLPKMIEAGGYDWTDNDITAERFPVKGEGTAERKLVLVHLGREATTDEILAEMKRRGLKPAAIEDFLAFGAKYPDEQRKFPIVGLDFSWVDADGSRNFPYLDGSGGKRGFGLHWYWHDGRWNESCRFLALCE
jgi:hypothetical protein